jgi:hypothetical protein
VQTIEQASIAVSGRRRKQESILSPYVHWRRAGDDNPPRRSRRICELGLNFGGRLPRAAKM